MQGLVKKSLKALHAIESGLLALLLSSMIGVAAVQVIMRNFFDSGLYWGDSAVRVMVLWVAMLGAMVASRTDEHIRIDLVNHFLPDHIKRHARRLINLFTLAILVIFTWSSAIFVGYEYEDQTIAFGEVPTWWCEIIMPIGAAVMSVRYALQVLWPKT
ncbi:MAG: TRAP transporter small permease subunit [Pseudomonadales bacterium]|nr:TRAP transporter small permease subunit [Pseudomonadales bacterium]